MKILTDKNNNIALLLTLFFVFCVGWGAARADENYDPDINLQVPHQSILNNESLPGTTGNSGAMVYRFPVKVAPGRTGLQPEIDLVYNSSSRQSTWVGVGWSLDLGSIQRSSKRRINFDDNDAFVCNGVDLVRRTDWGTGQYGARIEGEFSRYDYNGAASGWEVRTQSGTIYRYGTVPNSRQATSEGVFKWLLDEIEDANGNSLTVSYTNTAGEEICPYQINYAPAGSYVRFITESRNDTYPLYSSHTRVEPSSRLKEIRCYGGNAQAHRYVLNYGYSDHSGRSLLTSIREYGSGTGTVLPPTTFDYTSGTTVRFSGSAKTRNSTIANDPGLVNFADINGDGLTDLIKFNQGSHNVVVHLSNNSSTQFAGANPSTLEASTNPGGVHFGDINGDGKADCVIAQQGLNGAVTARAYLGESDGDLNYAGQTLSLNANFHPGLVQLADVDGDGLADLVQFISPGSGARVHLADGTGKFNTSALFSDLCRSNSTGRVFMADLNGDGMSDVIQTDAMNHYVYVHLADGAGYFDACAAGTDLEHVTDPGTLQFGDINGDGFSDLILCPALSSQVYTYFSNGNGGFVSAGRTDTNQTNDKGYVNVADVNGDGLADLIKGPRTGNRVYLYLGDGSGCFTSHNDIDTANSGFAAVVDVNGDGLADLVKYSTQVNTQNTYVYLAQGLSGDDVHADLLETVNNGYGVISTINYALSTALDDVHEPSGGFPHAYLPYPLDLVTAIVINDGIGHSHITTGYEYAGARYHIGEREFLGMGRIIRTNPNDTTLTTTFAVNDYYLKGRATASNYDDDLSSDYLNTTHVWEKIDLEDNGAQWVRAVSQESDLRSGGAVVSSDTAYAYHYHSSDAYGHVYQTIQTGSGAGTLTTTTDYTEKGNWIWRLSEQRIQEGSVTARNIAYGYDAYGNCTRETHRNNSGSDAVIERGFDGNGNLQWEEDPNGNRTSYSYTSDNSFLGSKNFEGLTTNYYSYNQWGKPGRMQDENGGNTNYDYDSYGRVQEEDYPGPGVKTIDYDDSARPRRTITRINSGQDEYVYIDGLDRILQKTIRGADGNHKTTRIHYDGAGRNYNTAGPFFTSGYGYFTSSIPSSAPYRNVTGYDFLNRPKSIQSPRDGSGTAATTIGYSGFNRTVTDPDGRSTTEYRDYLGRIQTIRDANNQNTDYNYNGAGDLTRVTDPLGNRIAMTRNTLGHLTVLDDPDLGRWVYTYKPNGEVRTRTDQQGRVITYGYNDRNQLTSKTYTQESPDEPDVALTYDSAANGNGRLYTVTKGGVTTTYNAYDDMGRVTEKTVTIDGQDYPFSYTYDGAGNLTGITYPDGYGVAYDYHSGTSLPASISAADPAISVSLSDYSNLGKPGTIEYPGSSTLIDYFSRTGRVEAIEVPGLMAISYDYTAAGDVHSIYDTLRNFSYIYQYDTLHRLTKETAVGPFLQPSGRNISLYYEGTEPHAVSRVVAEGQERSLIYEDNGNLTIGYDFGDPGAYPERRIQYNAENMPLTIEYEPDGGPVTTTQLTYDGDGRRVKKQSGGSTVIYVDETYEIRNGQPVKYIFAGGRRVARVTGATVHYYHKDHLGSSTVVTDVSGNLTDSMVYEAFGQPRKTCQPQSGTVDYTYTDQEWDGETGLYNYDARLYDAVLGRFLSADSVVPDWYDPQALNRYSYARNNPMVYVDPDGHSFLDAVPGTMAAIGCYGGTAIAWAFSRPALGVIWLADRSSYARINSSLNDTFVSVLEIQTKYVAAPAVTGDAIGLGVLAASTKAASKQVASGTEVVGEVAAKRGVKNADDVIHVTPDGVSLPKGRKIPDHYVENPHGRPGSYGEMVDGKFQEKLRIDPATPPGKKGPNYSHYHKDGKRPHYSPRPGDKDPGF